MRPAVAMLHALCGKIASGKSTLGAVLVEEQQAILVDEDRLLSMLFPEDALSPETFLERSDRLERAITPLLVSILRRSNVVVLDFHANTRHRRRWIRSLIDAAGADHVLHWLDVPEAVCKERLRLRNARGDHAFEVTDALFDRFTAYFEPPKPDEGWTVRRYGDSSGSDGLV